VLVSCRVGQMCCMAVCDSSRAQRRDAGDATHGGQVDAGGMRSALRPPHPSAPSVDCSGTRERVAQHRHVPRLIGGSDGQTERGEWLRVGRRWSGPTVGRRGVAAGVRVRSRCRQCETITADGGVMGGGRRWTAMDYAFDLCRLVVGFVGPEG
jgi:hypothetical protein